MKRNIAPWGARHNQQMNPAGEKIMFSNERIVILKPNQTEQIKTALQLARTCLMCTSVNDNLKEEAIKALGISQQTLIRKPKAQ